MNITIRFIGSLRSLVGKGKLSMRFRQNTRLKEAIGTLAAEVPLLQLPATDANVRDFRINTLILVNGKDISVLDDLETVLKDGDEVIFVPVLHGG